MRYYFLFLVSLMASIGCFAQAPVIYDIQPLSAGPTQKIVITGSGFSSTSSQLQVWFDHVKGTITSSTNFSIEVQVPPQAHSSNVEVINLSNKLSAKSQMKFLPSYGGAQFALAKMVSAYSNIENNNELFDVASSDFDLDGKPDVVTTKGGPNGAVSITDINIYQNASSGIGNINFNRFDKSNLSALNVTAPTTSIACGDLNGDGKPDIVATGGGTKRNQIFLLQNTNSAVGTMSFVALTNLILPPPDPSNPNKNAPLSFEVVIRDLNSDGKPELIISNAQDDSDPTTDNRIFVFQNNTTPGGAPSFIAAPIQLSVPGANSTYGIDVQDVDGDAMPDIILNQFFSTSIFILRNTSTGNISFAAVPKLGALGSLTNIIASDLNNDGKPELLATATNDNNMQIWVNQSTPGNINFGTVAAQTLSTTFGPWGIETGDIDGDGDVDFLVAAKNGSNLNIFTQDTPMTFTRQDFATTGNFSRNLKLADYDADGKPDIVYTGIPSASLQYTLNVIRNANCWSPVITSAIGATSPQPICVGQKIRLQTKPAFGVTYDWQLNGSSTQPGAKDTLQASAAGTYTVTINGTVDGSCSNQSAGFVLNTSTGGAPPNPPINNNVPCLGSVLNLSTPAVATATYKWTGPSFSSSLQSPTINPVTNGTGGVYTLQVTVGSCSSNITSKTLDVKSVPVIPVTASPSATVCSGTTVILSLPSGISGYTYQWKNNSGNMAGHTADSLHATLENAYSVVLTDTVTNRSKTCSQETAKTTVRVFTKPVANFSAPSIGCKGDSILFTNSSTGDNRGTLNYTWAFDDGGSSTLKSPKHPYASVFSFHPNLTVFYSEFSSCTSFKKDTIAIVAPVPAAIQKSASPICSGDKTKLWISGSFASITWSGGVTGSTDTVLVYQPGILYKVKTTDTNGCKAKDSLTIASKPLISPFVVKAGRLSINAGDTTQLTATTGADSYLWSPPSTLNDSSISNPIATPLGTTKYVVLAKKATFCDAKDSVTVNVNSVSAIINPPVLFSPNGDKMNDEWKLCYNSNPSYVCPEELKYSDYTMTIFDGHGSLVYQQKGFTHWDGGSAPDGVYYYVFSNSKDKPATGSILLVRQKQ